MTQLMRSFTSPPSTQMPERSVSRCCPAVWEPASPDGNLSYTKDADTEETESTEGSEDSSSNTVTVAVEINQFGIAQVGNIEVTAVLRMGSTAITPASPASVIRFDTEGFTSTANVILQDGDSVILVTGPNEGLLLKGRAQIGEATLSGTTETLKLQAAAHGKPGGLRPRPLPFPTRSCRMTQAMNLPPRRRATCFN